MVVFFLTGALASTPSMGGNSSVNPVMNNGKPWRIAYYEGGSYTDYADAMKSVIKGLMTLGWIEKDQLPDLKDNLAKPYWEWLVHSAKSPYLMFHDEDAYSADWSEGKRNRIKKELIGKLQQGHIDLVVAMGTWAGQDLANRLHHVPTTVVSTSNPVQAKIIQSAEDSGLDHVTARVDPKRYLRQIRMFHRLVKFRKLGVAFEDTPEGRIYSPIVDLEKVAAERGFDLVLCPFNDTQVDRDKAFKECMECMDSLSKRADAVYVTSLLAMEERVDQVADFFRKKKIPTFALNGSKYVKEGFLLSVSTDEGYRAQGLYDARKIARILNGTHPRDLQQVFPDPLDIAINMKTARDIGFAVPGSIIRIAHEIYEQNTQ
jgi:ABC-type uncharacterized transport system substrate-binding protein